MNKDKIVKLAGKLMIELIKTDLPNKEINRLNDIVSEIRDEALTIPVVVGQSEQLPILERCECEEPNDEPIKVCMNCNGYVE